MRFVCQEPETEFYYEFCFYRQDAEDMLETFGGILVKNESGTWTWTAGKLQVDSRIIANDFKLEMER